MIVLHYIGIIGPLLHQMCLVISCQSIFDKVCIKNGDQVTTGLTDHELTHLYTNLLKNATSGYYTRIGNQGQCPFLTSLENNPVSNSPSKTIWSYTKVCKLCSCLSQNPSPPLYNRYWNCILFARYCKTITLYTYSKPNR